MNQRDSYGGPQGLEQWRLFALSHGKPIALSKWGLNPSTTIDNSYYITSMHGWFRQHAGTGAGKVLYEVKFHT